MTNILYNKYNGKGNEAIALNNNLKRNRSAIILLHEIYGINEFMQKQHQQFSEMGYDVFCPDMLDKQPFPYEESMEAYDYFMKKVGFEVYKEISALVTQLKLEYDNVFIAGFSVGATIAWRCCENSLCSGIVACYGSRIRDYKDVNPKCPTLLLIAKEDSFDVNMLGHHLRGKDNLTIIELDAVHGFMDSYSKHFNVGQSKLAEESITRFLHQSTK